MSQPAVIQSNRLFTFQWKLNNLTKEFDSQLSTPTFLAQEVPWRLFLTPSRDKIHISIHLQPALPLSAPKEVEFCVYLRREPGTRRRLRKSTMRHRFFKRTKAGFERFLARSELSKYVHNGQVVLGIEMYYQTAEPAELMEDLFASEETESEEEYDVPEFFEKLNDPSFSDVEFLVDSRVIYASKFLLKARSRYFRDLFGTSSFSRDDPYKIHVDGFHFEPLLAVLAWIYTGRIHQVAGYEENPIGFLCEMYAIARMYSLKGLVLILGNRFNQVIDLENFDQMMELSTSLDIPLLLAKVCAFAALRWKDVCNSNALLRLFKSKPTLSKLLFNGVLAAREGATEVELISLFKKKEHSR
ncbi:hypothetical protein K493DRAFT_339301 [Basidiobolus meristosporus CBS 931.73]|uniref:BTB domain-containing protein n=1 Tax=Basidiobolus meristosporus CBS 931.73 TaxID=1314790 RepID=A0A1Y1Y0J7_9FUNG|nr:hypothetical protein K493DRAFT_339301 [Basidiobolus meristosporus CBS 931.73]|eukprot:ORX91531.1 hypothetical protein K493DRAFT_339301 [Basidiobolus meristosporus CBS 931.73]